MYILRKRIIPSFECRKYIFLLNYNMREMQCLFYVVNVWWTIFQKDLPINFGNKNCFCIFSRRFIPTSSWTQNRYLYSSFYMISSAWWNIYHRDLSINCRNNMFLHFLGMIYFDKFLNIEYMYMYIYLYWIKIWNIQTLFILFALDKYSSQRSSNKFWEQNCFYVCSEIFILAIFEHRKMTIMLNPNMKRITLPIRIA